VFAITATPTLKLSITKATTITVKYTNAGSKDTLEWGICNDDASSPSPLSEPGVACSVNLGTASKSGSGSFKVKLTPGLQGSGSLSGCPQSNAQSGLGISCIVAAADINAGTTAYVPLYFAAKAAKASGKKYTGTITTVNGFATDGLYGSSPSTLATGCQAFSQTAPAASWTGQPLCNDGTNNPLGTGGSLPEGYGFATGEPVEVLVGSSKTNGTLVCNPTLSAGAPGACPYANADAPDPVASAGGVSYSYLFPAAGTYYVTLVGAASGVTNGPLKVTVSATGHVT
jgi:hypothetical protein